MYGLTGRRWLGQEADLSDGPGAEDHLLRAYIDRVGLPRGGSYPPHKWVLRGVCLLCTNFQLQLWLGAVARRESL